MNSKLGIKLFKENKTGGAVNTINEFFKHCHIDCINIIVDVVNIVQYTGLVYTKKCLPSDPDNYKGITLLSCTCKLFTACINKRQCPTRYPMRGENWLQYR